MPEIVPEAMAEAYRVQMKRPDLTFMTPENEAQMQKEICERRAACKHDWEEIPIAAVGKHPAMTRYVCKGCLIDKEVWEDAVKTLEAKQ